MPKETASKTVERLRKEDRRRSLDELTPLGRSLRAELVFSTGRLDKHVELLAIIKYLERYEEVLRPVEQVHLKKMAALEARRTPIKPLEPGDYEFIDVLESRLGSLSDEAASFESDLSDVTKRWQTARDDLLQLSENIRQPQK